MAKRDRHGLTLAELTIALVITTLVGLAVAGVGVALSSAHEHSEEYYLQLQNARAGMMRVQGLVHNARLIVAGSETEMVIWSEDTNLDNAVNLSELVLLRYDPNTAALTMCRMELPQTMSAGTRAALDTSETLEWSTRLDSVTAELAQNSYSPQRVLAENMRGLRFRYNADPPETTLVQVEMDMGLGDRRFDLRSAAALRAGWTSYLGKSRGHWVLAAPDVTLGSGSGQGGSTGSAGGAGNGDTGGSNGNGNGGGNNGNGNGNGGGNGSNGNGNGNGHGRH